MLISEKRHPGLYHLAVDALQQDLKFGTHQYFEALQKAENFINVTYEGPGQLDYEQLLSFDAIQVGTYATAHGISAKPLRCARFIAGLTAVKPETLHCASCGRFALKYEGVKYVAIEAKTACPTCGELLLLSSRDNPFQIDWTTNTMIESGPKTRRVAGYAREFEVDPEGIMRRVEEECERPVHPLVIDLCAKSDITVAQFLNELLWGETEHIFHKNHMKALMALAGGTSEFRMVDIKLVGHNAAERAQGQKNETPKVSEASLSLHMPGVPKIFVLSTKSDSSHLKKFNTHMFLYAKAQKLISLRSTNECSVGEDLSNFIEREIEDADIVVIFISPKFIEDYYDTVLQAIKLKKRVVPVLLTDCDWRKAAFGGLRPLPRNENSIDNWKDADSAWVDVISGLRQLWKSV